MDAHEDDPRRLLGELLRQARAEAGFTQDAVGHAIGVDRSGVTRMEGGTRLITRDMLETWLTKCRVTGLAEAGTRAMWRVARRAGDSDEPVKVWFVGWVDAEGKAHTLRFWQPDIVPGLLQTEQYAYHTFRAFGLSHDRATEAAKARIGRQVVLERDKPPVVVALIDELVLQREIGSPEIMAGQCKRLLELGEYPTVHIQVVRGASAGLGGSLALAEGKDGTVMLSGSLLEDIVTADAQQVLAASAIVDAVRGAAMNASDSRGIIGEAHKRWTT